MTKWQIFGAAALRKLPELIPKRDPIELKVQEMFWQWELSLSRYSQHEMDHIADQKAKEDPDLIIKQTAQDREDQWTKELEKFKAAPHNDRLSQVQYLFVDHKFGSDIKDQWLLPHAEYDPKQDKTLACTIRRALNTHVNIVNGYRILSPVPSSVYTFKYPKKIAGLTGFDGAKVFFVKAHMDKPSDRVLSATNEEEHKNVRWLTRKEASQGLVKRRYMESFGRGLLHENRVDTNRVYDIARRYAKAIRSKASVANAA